MVHKHDRFFARLGFPSLYEVYLRNEIAPASLEVLRVMEKQHRPAFAVRVAGTSLQPRYFLDFYGDQAERIVFSMNRAFHVGIEPAASDSSRGDRHPTPSSTKADSPGAKLVRQNAKPKSSSTEALPIRQKVKPAKNSSTGTPPAQSNLTEALSVRQKMNPAENNSTGTPPGRQSVKFAKNSST